MDEVPVLINYEGWTLRVAEVWNALVTHNSDEFDVRVFFGLDLHHFVHHLALLTRIHIEV